MIVISYFMAAFGLIFNFLQIGISIKQKRYKTNIHVIYLIISLSNLAAAMSLIGTAVLMTNQWNYFIQNFVFIIFTSVLQSLLLVGVAIDRYIAIVKQLHYSQLISRFRILGYALSAIIFSLLFCSAICMLDNPSITEQIPKAVANNQTLTLILMFGPQGVIFMRVWVAIHLSIGACMIGLYVPVLAALRKQLKRDSVDMRRHPGTILLCAVIVVFTVSWIPMSIMFFVPQFLNMNITDVQQLISVGATFAFSSTCVNPFLYGLSACKICKQAQKTCCKKNNNNVIHVETSKTDSHIPISI